MTLDLSDAIQRHLFFGLYEVAELRLLKRYLRRGSTFVDVGANVGAFTALASKIVGKSGRVLAIEPLPILHRRLVRSFDQRNQVTVVPTASGARPGFVHLYVPPPSMGNLDPSVVEYCEGMERIEVEVQPLDDVLRVQNVSSVDFLKIDVEGYEPEVLSGAGEYLRRRLIKAVLVELNEPLLSARGCSAESIHGMLLRSGFKLKQVLAVGSSYCNALYLLAG